MEPHRNKREQAKRIFDLIGAAASALMLLPLVGLIALIIKLEGRGPVLYRQERLGRNRRPFQILKFRTMVVDAERQTGPTWAMRRDPRATPVGRLLRASHLDELPQLWNVIRGEMSLVGPRPERGHFVAQFEPLVPRYAERFAARPGIAGLSQIRSGYDESIRTVRRKVRYDRFYIQRACLLLDLWLLTGTVGHLMALERSHRASPAPRRMRPRLLHAPRMPQLWVRMMRFAGMFGLFALIATSPSSIQASPGSSLPREGIGPPPPSETSRTDTRTAFPWPGGAAILQSAGLDSELVLSAETEPAGGELENGSLESWDPYSLAASGKKKERKKKDRSGLPRGEPKPEQPELEPVAEPEPEPVPEPSAALLLGSGALWFFRRRSRSAATAADPSLRERKHEPL